MQYLSELKSFSSWINIARELYLKSSDQVKQKWS